MRLLQMLPALPLTACSTVVVHVDEPGYLYPYKGTQRSIDQVSRFWSKPLFPGEVRVRA